MSSLPSPLQGLVCACTPSRLHEKNFNFPLLGLKQLREKCYLQAGRALGSHGASSCLEQVCCHRSAPGRLENKKSSQVPHGKARGKLLRLHPDQMQLNSGFLALPSPGTNTAQGSEVARITVVPFGSPARITTCPFITGGSLQHESRVRFNLRPPLKTPVPWSHCMPMVCAIKGG